MQGVSAEIGDAAAAGKLIVASTPVQRSGRPRPLAGVAFVVASATAFGAMAIFARYAYRDGVDTTTLLALRFAIAAALLVVACGVARVRWPRGRDLATLVGLGAIGYAGQAASFFTALTLAPAGLVALLLYLNPAIVAVLAAWRGHETLAPRTLAALAIALAGMALTVGPALSGATAGVHPAGVALGVLSAVIYAVYIVVSTGVASRVDPLAMSTVVIASAAVLFAALALARGPVLPASAIGWVAVAAIAVVSTVAAITWFFAGLKRIGPTRASTLSTVEPAVTVALAALVLDERIAVVQLFGGALILAAVVLLARSASGKGTVDGR
ncbi:MAG TPA: DMT family transporter [Casimicrobiaceae bacterium]|nr:DMT family transporter [Casimicrobiaceae bacterium]